MPTVPTIPGGMGASGSSPLGTQPSPTDLLMATAELHQSGRLTKFKQPNPAKPHSDKRKLKVIK